MEVSPAGSSDNPFLTGPPGGTLTYHINIPQDHPQGTFWYHDHQMCPSSPPSSSCAKTESQIFSGLSGTILLGPVRPAAIPSGAMPTAPASLVSAPIAQRRTVVLSMNPFGNAMYINGRLPPRCLPLV